MISIIESEPNLSLVVPVSDYVIEVEINGKKYYYDTFSTGRSADDMAGYINSIRKHSTARAVDYITHKSGMEQCSNGCTVRDDGYMIPDEVLYDESIDTSLIDVSDKYDMHVVFTFDYSFEERVRIFEEQLDKLGLNYYRHFIDPPDNTADYYIDLDNKQQMIDIQNIPVALSVDFSK